MRSIVSSRVQSSASSSSRRASAASVARRRASSSSSASAPSSWTPDQRITAGSVSPCSTSVAKITPKVMNSSWSRAGKSAGSASAAASETAPRMPAQPTTTRPRQLPRRATWLARRSSARIA